MFNFSPDLLDAVISRCNSHETDSFVGPAGRLPQAVAFCGHFDQLQGRERRNLGTCDINGCIPSDLAPILLEDLRSPPTVTVFFRGCQI